MTAAEYEVEVRRYLTGQYAVPETEVAGWRVQRLDRSSDAVVVSTFHASKPLHPGGIRLQSDSPESIAAHMARWDAS